MYWFVGMKIVDTCCWLYAFASACSMPDGVVPIEPFLTTGFSRLLREVRTSPALRNLRIRPLSRHSSGFLLFGVPENTIAANFPPAHFSQKTREGTHFRFCAPTPRTFIRWLGCSRYDILLVFVNFLPVQIFRLIAASQSAHLVQPQEAITAPKLRSDRPWKC